MGADDPDPCGPDRLRELKIAELLRLSRQILAELRRREVIRSGNAPAGDYSELLVKVATGGELAPASQKSWDVETPAGERLQVKARVLSSKPNAGERELSPFRTWEFDSAVIVLFDDEFQVWRAAKLEPAQLQAAARYSQHVKGDVVRATDALLAQGVDWTERLRAAADE